MKLIKELLDLSNSGCGVVERYKHGKDGLKMTFGKKEGTGRLLMESHYLFTVMWGSWNQFLTSFAVLERGCG